MLRENVSRGGAEKTDETLVSVCFFGSLDTSLSVAVSLHYKENEEKFPKCSNKFGNVRINTLSLRQTCYTIYKVMLILEQVNIIVIV